MATFTKINTFALALGQKKHNLGSDQLKVALTNTDPTATANVYADLTSPLATTNLSGATPFNITTTSWTQTGGLASLVLVDLVLTASGGDVGPFRYVVIYNDTATNDELIGYYDYGAAATITDGNTFTIDFNEANTLLTLQ
jgi:hypothetical protein